VSKIKDPTIYKNLDCSTVHITKQDGKLLDQRDCPLSIQNVDYGWMVYCRADNNMLTAEELESLTKFGFSEAFIDLFTIARFHGCKWLDLDCDGMTYDDLPKFAWEKDNE
jgi:hypothetical protein